MDVQPIDQGAILRSGFAGVPDYATQELQQQQAETQRNTALAEIARAQTAQQHEQREAASNAAFQADVQSLPQNPTAADYARLMIRHPQMSEAVQRGYHALDADQQQQTFQSLAEINSAARGGDFALASRLLHARDEADTAAGHPPDAIHAAIQAALDSGDPAQQAHARDLLERLTAAVAGPEHYAGVYGTFQRDLHEFNGVLYDAHTGEAVSQDPRGRIIPGPNGSFNEEPPISGVPMLGGVSANAPAQVGGQDTGGRQDGGAFANLNTPAPPAPPPPSPAFRPRAGANAHPVADAGSIISAIYPHATITSTRRDPNSALGRANPHSWHNTTGAAVDVAPIQGMTFNQYVAGIRSWGYEIIEARDEVTHPARDTTGPNWHVVIGRSQPVAGTIARVNTAQQYAALPHGAQYVDPQGVHRTKQ